MICSRIHRNHHGICRSSPVVIRHFERDRMRTDRKIRFGKSRTRTQYGHSLFPFIAYNRPVTVRTAASVQCNTRSDGYVLIRSGICCRRLIRLLYIRNRDTYRRRGRVCGSVIDFERKAIRSDIVGRRCIRCLIAAKGYRSVHRLCCYGIGKCITVCISSCQGDNYGCIFVHCH